jgi:hypothetical protein
MKIRWLYVTGVRGALALLCVFDLVACQPERSLATLSKDELGACIVEAMKRQGYSYSQPWEMGREGQTVTVMRSYSSCESAKAACQPGQLGASCFGYKTTYRVLWQDGRCVLTDEQRSIPWEGEVECPPTPPATTPAMHEKGRPPREGPRRTPTTCPSMLPAFWPTGMPSPTRAPAVVKRAIPTDKETCLQMGGFWDTPFCTGLMRPTDIPPPELSCWEVPTADACRPCSDDSECEGWCSVPPAGRGPPMTGVCSPIARQWKEERFVVQDGQIFQTSGACE